MTPILYSFRRCPYAMRARLAIASAGVQVELREIVLRDKAPEFLAASPKATVPVVVDGDRVIEESFDVMLWALGQNDPEGWLSRQDDALIAQADGPFKTALDRYKYASRYDDVDASAERSAAALFLADLDKRLASNGWLMDDQPRLSDMAILPFVRQFAHVDLDWFTAQPWPHLITWLNRFKSSPRFLGIMQKYPRWNAGDPVTMFPKE